MSGEDRIISSQLNILCSQRGVSFRRMQPIDVYNCEGVGQSSSSVVMGITIVNVVDV